MNKYSSVNRFLRARNVVEATIAPPADFTIAAASWVPQLFTPNRNNDNTYPVSINNNSNLILKSLGVYSNFADGLVFKTPADRIDVDITVGMYSQLTHAGTVTVVQGTKTVTGLGTNFGGLLSVGSIIRIGDCFYIVASFDGVSPNTILYTTDYIKVSTAGVPWWEMAIGVSPAQDYFYEDISQLNTQFPIDKYCFPSLYGATGATTVLITGKVNLWTSIASVIRSNHDITFMTKSINTAFVGDTAFFDLGIELEYGSV